MGGFPLAVLKEAHLGEPQKQPWVSRKIPVANFCSYNISLAQRYPKSKIAAAIDTITINPNQVPPLRRTRLDRLSVMPEALDLSGQGSIRTIWAQHVLRVDNGIGFPFKPSFLLSPKKDVPFCQSCNQGGHNWNIN